MKGAWNWLLGRGLPTGKELYSKMVDEADDMIMAMEEGREVDILAGGHEVFWSWTLGRSRFRGRTGPDLGNFGSFEAKAGKCALAPLF